MAAPISRRLADAHNHLQDQRWQGEQERLLTESRALGVRFQVVNGTRHDDWPAVADLARRHADIIPCFGYHPWYVSGRPANWLSALEHQLDQIPHAGVGEIGLDRWWIELPASARRHRAPLAGVVEPASLEVQVTVFSEQLRVAVRRELPVMIHCLRAWGLLRDALQSQGPLPAGFLLHSYSGPAEMIPEFVRLGGRFSFSGYFLHERKRLQREVFRQVPLDRLLVETDAPDQALPQDRVIAPALASGLAEDLNHPGNLPAVYVGLAECLGLPISELIEVTAGNFARFFRVPEWN